MQNAFIESSNGHLRDERLNETLSSMLILASVALSDWKADCNGPLPHSELGWRPPSAFATTFRPRRDLHQIPSHRPRTGHNQEPRRIQRWIEVGGNVNTLLGAPLAAA